MKQPRYNIDLQTPIYQSYFDDYGHPLNLACQALTNYALNVGSLMQDVDGEYEGDKDRPINYRQLMRTTASLYGVPPDQMVKFWPQVDKLFRELKLPPITIPASRFNSAAIIALNAGDKI